MKTFWSSVKKIWDTASSLDQRTLDLCRKFRRHLTAASVVALIPSLIVLAENWGAIDTAPCEFALCLLSNTINLPLQCAPFRSRRDDLPVGLYCLPFLFVTQWLVSLSLPITLTYFGYFLRIAALLVCTEPLLHLCQDAEPEAVPIWIKVKLVLVEVALSLFLGQGEYLRIVTVPLSLLFSHWDPHWIGWQSW